MMTSRSEYRLILRQDNADKRLTPYGYQLGLISEKRYRLFCEKVEQIDREIKRLKKTTIPPSKELNELLVSRETSEMKTGQRAAELVRRPQIGYDDLAPFDLNRPELSREVREQVEVEIKYEGYIKKQLLQVEEMRKLEGKALPGDLDYDQISGLRLEAVEKLKRVKPLNIGQASRISGVSPADISVLLIWLEQQRQNRKREGAQ